MVFSAKGHVTPLTVLQRQRFGNLVVYEADAALRIYVRYRTELGSGVKTSKMATTDAGRPVISIITSMLEDAMHVSR
ncbi:hypothetical protein CEXT_739251 [Caerostris extrusa]|uniref:Uncharacterized protein n=1 Tax=Caerostris extrusa TaxID=172846 RepID=A0AAV4XV82_CAEEX|nr:hypothetical protein CEXT_739251 [Caerostris extrusa]